MSAFMPELLPQIGSSIGEQSPMSDAPWAWQSLLDFGNSDSAGDPFGKGGFFGNEGGFGSLMGFGKDAFNIYGGMQKLDMMQNMFDEQSKYAATNLYNQGVMLDESRDKQRATLSGNWAPGQAPNRSYLDNPEQIKRTV